MHNERFKFNKAILESLEKAYSGNICIFESKIPQSVKAVEHTALGKSIYLKKKEQDNLFDIHNREENFSFPLKLATMLKGISQNGELTYEKIDKLLLKR